MGERLIGIPARDAREDVWRSGRDLDDGVDRTSGGVEMRRMGFFSRFDDV